MADVDPQWDALWLHVERAFGDFERVLAQAIGLVRFVASKYPMIPGGGVQFLGEYTFGAPRRFGVLVATVECMSAPAPELSLTLDMELDNSGEPTVLETAGPFVWKPATDIVTHEGQAVPMGQVIARFLGARLERVAQLLAGSAPSEGR